jgi:hypothetical protein
MQRILLRRKLAQLHRNATSVHKRPMNPSHFHITYLISTTLILSSHPLSGLSSCL